MQISTEFWKQEPEKLKEKFWNIIFMLAFWEVIVLAFVMFDQKILAIIALVVMFLVLSIIYYSYLKYKGADNGR